MTIVGLNPGAVSLAELRAVWAGAPVVLASNAWADIDAAALSVSRILESGRTVYGVNTGFGKLAQTRIPADRLAELQRNLVLSHSVGIGKDLADNVVRLVMATKVLSLSRGHSGIRMAVIDALIALLNAGVYPCIPEKGSVGASGDLAPLAHLSLMLIGEGQVTVKGQKVSARDGLAVVGL